ncbi:DNA-directed RNA polymerase I subunit RPA12-like isoform X1 [Abrus precatorius]|uniref:DNA-directed RNA polymerase I subunit RPA12-like isoform X1 n=1 Tax=Abrus precatorius TaxID=3816 RepID=A0A8B8LV44_ABRPR|nr:DNA-directed RNA polymerase I subunit RPA12-like isoform X1 [Abrus precatorius]
MAYSRGRDFLYCHLCGTMLTVPSPKFAECPLCKTRQNIDDIRDREISYTISAEDIRRELGIEIIEEQKVQLSKVNKKCEKCGHDEATFYTRQRMKGKLLSTHVLAVVINFRRIKLLLL